MTDKPKVDVYTASDYAGMTAGPLSFYYGYEWGERDDDCEQWGFRAENTGVEILSLSSDDLIARVGLRGVDRFDVTTLLLAGIAIYLDELTS